MSNKGDKHITFTETSFKAFRERYKEVERAGIKSFVFEGNTFVTGYAKYLIEYLTPKFEKK